MTGGGVKKLQNETLRHYQVEDVEVGGAGSANGAEEDSM
jgi:hypothetical protein